MANKVFDILTAPPKSGKISSAITENKASADVFSVFHEPPRIVQPKPDHAKVKQIISAPPNKYNRGFLGAINSSGRKISQSGIGGVAGGIGSFIYGLTAKGPVELVKGFIDLHKNYPNAKIEPQDVFADAYKFGKSAIGNVAGTLASVPDAVRVITSQGKYTPKDSYTIPGLGNVPSVFGQTKELVKEHGGTSGATESILTSAANVLLFKAGLELPKATYNKITSTIPDPILRARYLLNSGILDTKVPVVGELPKSVAIPIKTEPKVVPDVTQMTPEEQLRAGIQPGKVPEKVPLENTGEPVNPLNAPLGKTRETGLVTSVKESPNIAQEIKSTVTGDYQRSVHNNLKTYADAAVKNDFEGALRIVRETKNNTAESNALALSVVDELQRMKKFDDAVEIIQSVGARATKQGQANAALALLDRLTPTGALRYAERIFRTVKSEFPKAKIELTPKLAEELSTAAEAVQKLPEGSRQRTIAVAKLYHRIYQEVPVSLSRRISMIQTMSQLLNPKTIIRNLGGNTGFAVGENVSNVVGAAIDKALSFVTKKRTQTLPSIGTQLRGGLRGIREGAEDLRNNIDTSPTKTQFEIQKQVFTNKLGKSAEGALNVSLRIPDRAAWQAAYDESMRNQIRSAELSGTKVGPKELAAMDENARLIAGERTFQDTNAVTAVFTGLKRALNHVGNNEFGLGDFILKYPKTPANLLARGLEYSPAGFIRGAYELIRPLIGKEFRQGQLVKYTSRAIVGTGTGVVLGSVLHRLGIITGKKEENDAVAAFQRSKGLGQYRLNVSALKRFVLSGFNPSQAKLKKGDVQVSYDWFQPAAIPLSIGANIDETHGSARGIVGTMVNSIAEGTNTLAEQPLVKNFQAFFRGSSLSQSAVSTLTGAPASFVPTMLYQFRQLSDNIARNTYNVNPLYEAWNLVQNKIPGLSKNLPATQTPTGEDQVLFADGKNTLVNVFLNPAFVSTYQGDKAADTLLNLYQEYGDASIFPHIVSKTVTVNGVTYQLTAQQMTEYQKFIGGFAKNALTMIAQNEGFANSSDQAKLQALKSIFSSFVDSGKSWILQHLYQKKDLKQK